MCASTGRSREPFSSSVRNFAPGCISDPHPSSSDDGWSPSTAARRPSALGRGTAGKPFHVRHLSPTCSLGPPSLDGLASLKPVHTARIVVFTTTLYWAISQLPDARTGARILCPNTIAPYRPVFMTTVTSSSPRTLLRPHQGLSILIFGLGSSRTNLASIFLGYCYETGCQAYSLHQ